MASIKKMEMAAALSENNYIQIQKGLFGLKQTAYSVDTRSEIDCFVFDYSPSEGDKMMHLLNKSIADIANELSVGHKPQKADIGNYRLECCVSKDRQFVAVQLFHYADFQYTPATNLKVFRGKDVETIAKLADL